MASLRSTLFIGLLGLVLAANPGCSDSRSLAGTSAVEKTGNPQVALYTVQTSFPGKVTVEFGPTTSYGFRTWERPTPSDGSPVKLYVAGMKANTTYHMRAVVKYDDGKMAIDTDRTFKTGSLPSEILEGATVKTGAGAIPQSGVELIDATLSDLPNYLEAYVTDLQGNMIWGYNYPDREKNSIVQPIKLLPNGNFGVVISYASQFVMKPEMRSKINTLREIDLAGNIIREMPLDELNKRLKTAGYTFTVLDYHHDFEVLPNGHWIVLGNLVKPFTDLPGFPGTTQVIADVVIDLDPDWNPVWVWNEFDHLDIHRHPMEFPDWTHTNAVLYSPDDGNLLISMRHQNWIVKVDYRNGEGQGNILWRLGDEGDFQLINGADPEDWFYAQHNPSFQTDKTAGKFTLAIFDNGNDREQPKGCDDPGQPACLYTTIPVMEVDEKAKTATLISHEVIPQAQYSFYGGATTRLANGNLEYDLCAEPGYTGIVREVTMKDAKLVWEMTVNHSNLYRANRIPSLYPGVQW